MTRTKAMAPYATSKFEEGVLKEADAYWERHRAAGTRAHWELGRPPKHSRKRAPVWMERTRGHTSLCRVCAERITKGTMRFGTNCPNPYGWQAYYWHPSCFTAQVLKEFAYAEELEEKYGKEL